MMIFGKNQAYLIAFKQELSFGSQIIATAPSEEAALNVIFDQIFHHQTIPGDYQVSQISRFDFLSRVGLRIFLKAMRETEPAYWMIGNRR
jgi:hypothetical protein